jgi:hypothetical protein
MKTWNLGYKKSKEKAKKIYSKIGRIPCPALNGEFVSFTRAGFTHLLRKGRIPRTRNEQKRRFALLSFAEKIIKNPEAVIIYRQEEIKEKVNRYGEKILLARMANFWTFVEKINDCLVKIVIRQVNNGRKHFFSIMSDNIRVPRNKTQKAKTKKSL